jgi:hypothetical protein
VASARTSSRRSRASPRGRRRLAASRSVGSQGAGHRLSTTRRPGGTELISVSTSSSAGTTVEPLPGLPVLADIGDQVASTGGPREVPLVSGSTRPPRGNLRHRGRRVADGDRLRAPARTALAPRADHRYRGPGAGTIMLTGPARPPARRRRGAHP